MAHDIDETAADWAVRLDRGEMAEDERAVLEAWLAADRRHRGALVRAQAGLSLIDNARAPRPEIVPFPEPVRSAPRWRPFSRPAHAFGLAAAACAAAVALTWLVIPGVGRFDTRAGEIRRVTLDDGSVAIINARSDINVAYEDAERRIDVESGEAWFQVAHNKARPFVVAAGPIRVRATGTAFAVRSEGGEVRVVVTEGTVLVWREGETRRWPLAAGQQALIAADRPEAPVAARETGPAQPLAWRDGGLTLRDMTVRDAVAEFNRYNRRQILVADEGIAASRMTGYFRLDNPEEFGQAVAQVSQGRMSSNGNEIVIEK